MFAPALAHSVCVPACVTSSGRPVQISCHTLCTGGASLSQVCGLSRAFSLLPLLENFCCRKSTRTGATHPCASIACVRQEHWWRWKPHHSGHIYRDALLSGSACECEGSPPGWRLYHMCGTQRVGRLSEPWGWKAVIKLRSFMQEDTFGGWQAGNASWKSCHKHRYDVHVGLCCAATWNEIVGACLL